MISLWRGDGRHEFRQAVAAGVGFSVVYDGKSAGPVLPEDWRSETAATGHQTAFRHPSGLVIVRQARPLPESDAVEYSLRLKNEGQAELPALAAIRAMDIRFAGDLVGGLSVVTCGGGGADAKFPPKDFAVNRTLLDPPQDTLTFGAEGGLPSRSHLPFFFVHNEAQAAGLFVGVGWTGQWRATIRVDHKENVLRLQAGLSGLDLRLRPGEGISGPTVLIGCYRGGIASGTNTLRRLLRDRYAPTVAGRPLVAPVLYTTWFDIGSELDEKLARTLIDRAAEMGQEVFLGGCRLVQGHSLASVQRHAVHLGRHQPVAGQLGARRGEEPFSLGPAVAGRAGPRQGHALRPVVRAGTMRSAVAVGKRASRLGELRPGPQMGPR